MATKQKQWRSRIVGHGEEDPTQLAANPLNSWKIHGLVQQNSIEGLLDEVGWFKSIQVDQKTGFVIDGHARVALAIARGEPSVPVEYVDLTEEEQALAIAFGDYTSSLITVDQEEFQAFLGHVKPKDKRVQSLLEQFSRQHGIDPTAKAAEEVPNPSFERMEEIHAEIGAEPGDLWLIPSVEGQGEHRLVCGDATDEATVKQALGDLVPVLMVTDPPYGVSYNPEWRADYNDGKGNHAIGEVENDERVDWSEAYRLFPGSVVYLWHAGIFAGEVAASLMACDFEIRAQIIWRKQAIVMGRGHYHWGHYHWGHEPCFYAVRRGQNANWHGDRKQSTVWDIANRSSYGKSMGAGEGADAQTGHGTQKPVEAMRRPIMNHTVAGDAVYDPFLGSGTTIAAAEITGRLGIGIELDPKYVSLCVQRFRDMGLAPYRADR